MSVIDDDNESLAREIDALPDDGPPAPAPGVIGVAAAVAFLAICMGLFYGLSFLTVPG